MSDIERELEEALHRALDPLAARPIPARRPVQSRGALKTLMGGAGAALTIKLLTGVAVAAAAITVVGATTTGSLNPTVWGQQVKQQVATCKDQLAQGQHGNDNGNGNGATGSGNGNANGHSKDKSKDHSAPQKTSSTAPPTLEPEPIDTVGGHPPATVTPGP